jgi:hypothetical protein
MKKLWWFVAGACFCLGGCITAPPPVEDYALARAAIEAARSVEAARHASGYWSQAEEAYRRAKLLYSDRDYAEAKIEFVRARIAAEKAENSARWLRQKNGEVL